MKIYICLLSQTLREQNDYFGGVSELRNARTLKSCMNLVSDVQHPEILRERLFVIPSGFVFYHTLISKLDLQ